jgi:tetrahydromethanopterin S-methyltransferase subunit B
VELVVDQITGWVSYKEEALCTTEVDPTTEEVEQLPLTTETVTP